MWLRLLGLCLGSFVAVYLVLDMMEKIPRFLRAGGNLGDIVMFFVYKLPEMVGQTASFSILMTTLLTLGLLSRNSEVIAMRSCGVSLLRIAHADGAAQSGSLSAAIAEYRVCCAGQLRAHGACGTGQDQEAGRNAVFKRNNIWFRSDNLILQAPHL
jgi:lipopolysaccharide export system permease protein